MNRLIKGMSYTFKRNLGWQDRLIRTVTSLGILLVYFLGMLPGAVGVVLAVIAGMVLATAVVSRCSICYIIGKCTIDAKERAALDARDIPYEI